MIPNHRPASSISRRDFLRLLGLSLAGLAVKPYQTGSALAVFPEGDLLGRACATLELKARPDPESSTVGTVYEDNVVSWVREAVGVKPYYIFSNQRWVETPDGYLYAPYVQKVRNLPNLPVSQLPASSIGNGMWAEVTVPYVDVSLVNDPTSNSWVSTRLENNQPLRIYYSQVFWVDRIEQNASGQTFYRINPNYYGGLDQLLAPAEALRPIAEGDLSPIRPEVERKLIRVDLSRQYLACYEDDLEVFACRVATGAKFDLYGNVVDKWSTPVGKHKITRKFISLQMSGGTTGAPYDLPGIGWSIIFATGGVAIHSTFWHQNYGDPMSHGCVNVAPEDAKWIFRWSQPTVTADPGMVDVTVTGQVSTPVEVVDA